MGVSHVNMCMSICARCVTHSNMSISSCVSTRLGCSVRSSEINRQIICMRTTFRSVTE